MSEIGFDDVRGIWRIKDLKQEPYGPDYIPL